jgi:hypothetical protein
MRSPRCIGGFGIPHRQNGARFDLVGVRCSAPRGHHGRNVCAPTVALCTKQDTAPPTLGGRG